MIIIGLFMITYGTRFIQITFVIILGSIFMQIFLKFYESGHIENTNPDFLWIFILLGFSVGVGVAFFTIAVITFVKISIGGYLGYIFSSIFYQFILRYIETTNPKLIFWITVSISILIGIFLIIFMVKQIMIVATSLIGSYIIIKGISLYAGRFPNEEVIFEMLKNQEYDQLSEVFIIYYLSFII
jgi:hypothetical protein